MPSLSMQVLEVEEFSEEEEYSEGEEFSEEEESSTSTWETVEEDGGGSNKNLAAADPKGTVYDILYGSISVEAADPAGNSGLERDDKAKESIEAAPIGGNDLLLIHTKMDKSPTSKRKVKDKDNDGEKDNFEASKISNTTDQSNRNSAEYKNSSSNSDLGRGVSVGTATSTAATTLSSLSSFDGSGDSLISGGSKQPLEALRLETGRSAASSGGGSIPGAFSIVSSLGNQSLATNNNNRTNTADDVDDNTDLAVIHSNNNTTVYPPEASALGVIDEGLPPLHPTTTLTAELVNEITEEQLVNNRVNEEMIRYEQETEAVMQRLEQERRAERDSILMVTATHAYDYGNNTDQSTEYSGDKLKLSKKRRRQIYLTIFAAGILVLSAVIFLAVLVTRPKPKPPSTSPPMLPPTSSGPPKASHTGFVSKNITAPSHAPTEEPHLILNTTMLLSAVDNYLSNATLAKKNYGDKIGDWDVSRVTDFTSVFDSIRNERCATFSEDLNNWNTSAATDMTRLFYGAYKFNGNISAWDVSRVTSMTGIFRWATSFDGNLSRWNVSRVKTMETGFANAHAFRGDGLSEWDVSGMTKMYMLFNNASSFKGDTISEWDVSKVTNMDELFNLASVFNGDISRWNVSQTTGMDAMFMEAASFNGNLALWDVSKVKYMHNMFKKAAKFNHDMCEWGRKLSVETDTSKMFKNSACPCGAPRLEKFPNTQFCACNCTA